MTEDTMKQRVADAFNSRFGELYYRNPLDGQYFPIPALEPGEFRVTSEEDGRTQLVREPLVGMTVRATVDAQSGLIAFEAPSFAYE